MRLSLNFVSLHTNSKSPLHAFNGVCVNAASFDDFVANTSSPEDLQNIFTAACQLLTTKALIFEKIKKLMTKGCWKKP